MRVLLSETFVSLQTPVSATSHESMKQTWHNTSMWYLLRAFSAKKKPENKSKKKTELEASSTRTLFRPLNAIFSSFFSSVLDELFSRLLRQKSSNKGAPPRAPPRANFGDKVNYSCRLVQYVHGVGNKGPRTTYRCSTWQAAQLPFFIPNVTQ